LRGDLLADPAHYRSQTVLEPLLHEALRQLSLGEQKSNVDQYCGDRLLAQMLLGLGEETVIDPVHRGRVRFDLTIHGRDHLLKSGAESLAEIIESELVNQRTCQLAGCYQ
jgi:hypothetical protein